MRVIFDTNAYSNLFRDNPEGVQVLRLAPRIGMPLVVMAELLSGFRKGSRYTANFARLEQFLALPRVELIIPNQATAFVYADIQVALEQAGQPIPTNDIWIAALAIQYNEPLFTFDRHFSRIEGLRVGSSADSLGI
jgi:tRNA(fMet)-specific endonuclease VapC